MNYMSLVSLLRSRTVEDERTAKRGAKDLVVDSNE